MAKVITFSRYFPLHHARAGEPTYFVEKIWESLNLYAETIKDERLIGLATNYVDNNFIPKHHTIRAGNRWKVGDKASLRVWQDKPYRSKQIEVAEVGIKKVWHIQIIPYQNADDFEILVDGKLFDDVFELCANDGITFEDFFSWFKLDKYDTETFDGQIICWNDEVNY